LEFLTARTERGFQVENELQAFTCKLYKLRSDGDRIACRQPEGAYRFDSLLWLNSN
jgi:hypothetical protein